MRGYVLAIGDRKKKKNKNDAALCMGRINLLKTLTNPNFFTSDHFFALTEKITQIFVFKREKYRCTCIITLRYVKTCIVPCVNCY